MGREEGEEGRFYLNLTLTPTTLTTFIQHGLGSPRHSNYMRKRNKRDPMAEEKVKLPLYVDEMMFYISFIFSFTYLFWFRWVLVVAGELLSCGRQAP